MPRRTGRRSKRVLLLGDLHCGALGGLTPPAWQVKCDRDSLERVADRMAVLASEVQGE